MPSTRVAILLTCSFSIFAAQFTVPPSLLEQGDSAIIHFTVSASTDVEVAILGGDNKVVRHLAAGVLGGETEPPSPLLPGLAQRMVWDGRDDDGRFSFNTPFSVRVRLGVFPKYEKRISTRVYGATRNAAIYFWNDTTGTFPGTLGRDSVYSTDTLLPMTHPVWRQNSAKGFTDTFPNGTLKIKFYEGGPKLDLTVSDADDRLIIGNAPLGMTSLSTALLDGISGNLIKVWTIVPVTTFLGSSMYYYGEPHFDWSGQYVFRDIGALTNDIFRFTPEGAPVPYASGQHIVRQKSHKGSDMRQRGLTTDRDGNIYQGHDINADDGATLPYTYFISKYDSAGQLLNDSLIEVYGNIGQGVRVDPRGNLFIGARVRPFPDTVPKVIRGRLEGSMIDKYSQAYWARVVYGSIVKFGPEGGRIKYDPNGNLFGGPGGDRIPHDRVSATNMKWMHFGASMQPTHCSWLGATCICYTPRFDVDRYGRVIFPNPFENEFKALDNNGNMIFRAHNRDFTNQVPVGLIHNVQTTDRGLYAADYINNQILCFTWTADAETTLTLRSAGIEGGRRSPVFHMQASPNPFYPTVNISFTGLSLSSQNALSLDIAIFDARGRRVLQSSTDAFGRFSWRPAGLPAGLYLIRAASGNRVCTKTVTLLH